MLLCSVLIMFMQAGFCCLESGLVRAKNSINVAIKNLCDFCLCTLVFWLLGYAIMFGDTWRGLIGINGFFYNETAPPTSVAFFLFQVVFCGTATTIISGAVAERMRFCGYLMVALLTSAVIYPVFGHWAWAGIEQGQTHGWLNRMGFIDFAGSTVVHSTGGWIALAAAIVIGPRLGRFGDSRNRIRGHNLPVATLGLFLLWIGWFGFNGGSTLRIEGRLPLIFLNTCLAGAIGGITSLSFSWATHRVIRVESAINGVIAGLVGITASCHIMTPTMSLAVGAIAAIICQLATALLARMKIDDVIAAVPAHACAGAWGTLAVALLGNPATWESGLTRWDQLGIQALGVATCFAWSFSVGYVGLRLINAVSPLRVSAEHERQGLNLAEHAASTESIDLLSDMERQRVAGDFSTPVYVEPHTEVGQIAQQYNRVLDRVVKDTEKLIVANQEISDMNEKVLESRDQAVAAQQQIEQKVQQLQEFNRAATGRELRMVELKDEVNRIATESGLPPRYDLSFQDPGTQPQPPTDQPKPKDPPPDDVT